MPEFNEIFDCEYNATIWNSQYNFKKFHIYVFSLLYKKNMQTFPAASAYRRKSKRTITFCFLHSCAINKIVFFHFKFHFWFNLLNNEIYYRIRSFSAKILQVPLFTSSQYKWSVSTAIFNVERQYYDVFKRRWSK